MVSIYSIGDSWGLKQMLKLHTCILKVVELVPNCHVFTVFTFSHENGPAALTQSKSCYMFESWLQTLFILLG